MPEYFQQFMANPLWDWVFFVIAVVLALILFFKSKNIRKPTYYIKSHNLVTDFTSKFNKLQMFYGGTNIQNLTVSKVAFWNDGREIINKSDIVDSDPLRIEAVGACDILDASVIKETNRINRFSVEKVDNKSVRILFDFLDKKGQGGAVQVIHTGTQSADIRIDGSVKGAGKPVPSYPSGMFERFFYRLLSSSRVQPTKPQPAKARRMTAIVWLLAGLVMFFPIALSQAAVGEKILGIAFFLFYLYFGYVFVRRRVPKDLEIVEEED